MGWGHCGTDSDGREIGYCISAKCDEPGCKAKIDRGLAYACGGMHGNETSAGTDTACEKYFCGKHLICVENKDARCFFVCNSCYETFKDQWKDD